MSKSNSEVLSGVVRSLKKAAQRHESGTFSDSEYIEQARKALERAVYENPLTDKDKCQYTKD